MTKEKLLYHEPAYVYQDQSSRKDKDNGIVTFDQFLQFLEKYF